LPLFKCSSCIQIKKDLHTIRKAIALTTSTKSSTKSCTIPTNRRHKITYNTRKQKYYITLTNRSTRKHSPPHNYTKKQECKITSNGNKKKYNTTSANRSTR